MTDETKAPEAPAETPTETPPTPSETPPTPSEAPKEAAPVDWRAAYVGDNAKALEFSKRFKTESELFDWAFQTRQKLSTAIIPPGDDATDEERAKYAKAIGVPEAAEGYEFKAPEGLDDEIGDEALSALAAKFLEKGIPAQYARDALAIWGEARLGARDSIRGALAKASKRAIAEWEAKEGPELDASRNAVAKAVTAFGAEGLDALQNAELMVDGVPLGMRLGDHPAFMDTFAKVGRRLAEAGSDVGYSEEQRDTMRDRLYEIQQESARTRDSVKRQKLWNESLELSKKITGTG